MRVAIPLIEEQFCRHFGRCDGMYLVELDRATSRCDRPRRVIRPRQQCDSLAEWLIELAVGCVLTGGIGAFARQTLQEHGIEVVSGLDGQTPEQVIQHYLEQPEQTGPNACNEDEHRRRHCRKTD